LDFHRVREPQPFFPHQNIGNTLAHL